MKLGKKGSMTIDFFFNDIKPPILLIDRGIDLHSWSHRSTELSNEDPVTCLMIYQSLGATLMLQSEST